MNPAIDWPARRLARFEAEAAATGSVAAWRRLRDLAAAVGRSELARMAHARWLELTRPAAVAMPSATPTEVRLRIRSAMPLARAAWLARWAAARGGATRPGATPDLIALSLPGGRVELERLLAAQPELVEDAE